MEKCKKIWMNGEMIDAGKLLEKLQQIQSYTKM